MKKSPPPQPPPREHETWSPPNRRTWPQRLLRGWGLVGTILCLVLLYGVFRGRHDYRMFKSFLSHKEVTKAMKLAAEGDSEGAIVLLEKAGARTPNDAAVLRALADFNESRQDPMTLYALRKLVNNGDSTQEDRERLCRLAFDWGHAELADTETLRDWALSDTASLELRPLELSARWMASRGQGAEAESRLRKALQMANDDAATPAIEVVLTRLLLNSPPAQAGKAEVIQECVALLLNALELTAPPVPIHGEAAKLLSAMALKPEWAEHITEAAIDRSRKALVAQAAALKNPVQAMDFRLQERGLQIKFRPSQKSEIVEEIVKQVSASSEQERAVATRWLIANDFPLRALEICDTIDHQLTDREWFTLRLDALHALKRYEEVKQLLSAPQQPLPSIVRAQFILTEEKSLQAPEEQVEAARNAVRGTLARAEFKDVLTAAGVMERTGEVVLAQELYDSLQNHSQAGLPARLGTVRCLSVQLERTPELIEALNSLLVLWPRSDEARSDLAYLRLLDKTHRQEDVSAVIGLANRNQWYLAYRIPAALALLRINDSAQALKVLDSTNVPWEQTRAGWRAVYAATLAANQRMDDARRWGEQLSLKLLRPGERRLLEDYAITPKP
jgi:hypothetical protein